MRSEGSLWPVTGRRARCFWPGQLPLTDDHVADLKTLKKNLFPALERVVLNRLQHGRLAALHQSVMQVATGAVSATVRGVTGLVGGVASGGKSMQGAASLLNIDRSDLLAPVNRRLQAQGMPPVTGAQLQAAMQDVANTALKQGQLSQQTIVAALARHTAMNQQEAQPCTPLRAKRLRHRRLLRRPRPAPPKPRTRPSRCRARHIAACRHWLSRKRRTR